MGHCRPANWDVCVTSVMSDYLLYHLAQIAFTALTALAARGKWTSSIRNNYYLCYINGALSVG